jgi:Flp pilus assembly CpaF family ATPase
MVAEQLDRAAAGRAPLAGAAELDRISTLVERELDTVAGDRLAEGELPLAADGEHALRRAVLARVVGLGRIQPYLDDPEISDIHIRGGSSVWLKLRDGSRRPGLPVADSDDELVELVRLAAARQGRSERRFDAAHPELNLQLADGSRLFATMAVSAQPSVVIRKHRFELASLADLEQRGMVDHRVAAVLSAAVRARRNVIVAGGTGTGKTTLLRALLNEVPVDERIITIEDAYELGIDRFSHLHPDHDMLQSRPANIEGKGTSRARAR